VLFHRRGVGQRHNAEQDAVDAEGAIDERRLRRTAKSCGPDTPTLVSSWRKVFPPATVANKPGHRGARGVTVKTIARGMPGETGVTVVTMLACLFYFTCEAAGASSARHSLRPLIGGFKEINGKPRAKSRRENAKPCLLLFENRIRSNSLRVNMLAPRGWSAPSPALE